MAKKKESGLDFIVDKLTHSIENVVTGDSFATDILVVDKEDLKNLNRKYGWVFNWISELKQPERDIYKLTIVSNASIIQGLISLQVREDHVYIHLIESAGFNKGKGKMYSGVPGNLVAFACKLAFQRGHEGNIAFTAKTQLIEHYTKTLGALHIGKNLMIIDTKAALVLTNKYF
ncbi:MAG: hypothetical protein CVU05_09715 [Bacteroidetes bacterium HGW-Bacteroidetes-21]|jgi:hypothetical protein|nr:MAG: hypothetical protein CVU05_09715 [Bacteroidetes bacterium HGW-Bacteroidetes-21]